jgi:hypothetical protein
MRRFLAFGFSVICAVLLAMPVMAQRGGGGARGSALGSGSVVSRGAMSHPLGGVINPPGGIANPPGIIGNRPYRGGIYGRAYGRPYVYPYPYAYSYYVPGYFDYNDSSAYFDPSYAPPPAANPYYGSGPAEAPPQQPVIINQYFGAQGPPPENYAPQGISDPQLPGDLIGTPSNYYLIAYKNHSVYPALAYWVEDKTLHYVTTQNTHNQASLDLIDLSLTKSLNQTRDVPFAIPGQ